MRCWPLIVLVSLTAMSCLFGPASDPGGENSSANSTANNDSTENAENVDFNAVNDAVNIAENIRNSFQNNADNATQNSETQNNPDTCPPVRGPCDHPHTCSVDEDCAGCGACSAECVTAGADVDARLGLCLEINPLSWDSPIGYSVAVGPDYVYAAPRPGSDVGDVVAFNRSGGDVVRRLVGPAGQPSFGATMVAMPGLVAVGCPGCAMGEGEVLVYGTELTGDMLQPAAILGGSPESFFGASLSDAPPGPGAQWALAVGAPGSGTVHLRPFAADYTELPSPPPLPMNPDPTSGFGVAVASNEMNLAIMQEAPPTILVTQAENEPPEFVQPEFGGPDGRLAFRADIIAATVGPDLGVARRPDGWNITDEVRLDGEVWTDVAVAPPFVLGATNRGAVVMFAPAPDGMIPIAKVGVDAPIESIDVSDGVLAIGAPDSPTAPVRLVRFVDTTVE